VLDVFCAWFLGEAMPYPRISDDAWSTPSPSLVKFAPRTPEKRLSKIEIAR